MDDKSKERLEELRLARVRREAQEQEEADSRELEEEELCLKLEEELKGRRGIDFEIINNKFGVFGLRKPDGRAISSIDKASAEKQATLQWNIDLLKHYIVPQERSLAWVQVAADRTGLCWETALAFKALAGESSLVFKKK